MHNIIIQVDTKPVSYDNWIPQDYFYDGFCGWIADYVQEVDDEYREYALKEFVAGYREIVKCSDIEKGFVIKNKDAFFKGILETLKKIVNNLVITDFYGNNMAAYHIEKLINDPFGTYIYQEGYGLRTVIDFLGETKECQKYYFGAVVNYHY